MYKSQIASLMLERIRRKAGQIGQLRPVIFNDICNVQISGITLMMIQRPAKCLKKVILSVQKCLEGLNFECILKQGNKEKGGPFPLIRVVAFPARVHPCSCFHLPVAVHVSKIYNNNNFINMSNALA